MEALVSIQHELLENLRRTEWDFEQTPQEYLQKSFVETKLEMLEDEYREFKKGHNAIIAQDFSRMNAYFTDGVYENFEELYVRYKTTLKEVLDRLNQEAYEEWREESKSSDEKNNQCCEYYTPYPYDCHHCHKDDESDDDEKPKKKSLFSFSFKMNW